jgi:hypothetical protein
MKRIPALLVSLAACSAPSGPGPLDDLSFELEIVRTLPHDVSNLRLGQTVLYAVRIDGKNPPLYEKYSAVEEQGSAIWVERKVPNDPKPPFIYKSKYDRAGRLIELWAGEPGSRMPAQLYPSPSRPGVPPPPRRDSDTAQAELKDEPDTITVGGQAYRCTKVTSTLTYPKGGKSTLTDWYSTEVPFPVKLGPKSLGGLVRRQFGRVTMEVASTGTRAQPELAIPRMAPR